MSKVINLSNKDAIYKATREVMDPELHVNIVDLGLIYNVEVDKGVAMILMTLTTPGCPLTPVFEAMIRSAVLKVNGIKDVSVKITFEPPWTPEMMHDEVRGALGF